MRKQYSFIHSLQSVGQLGKDFADDTHNLHEILIVRLCNKNETTSNELIGMLSLLFSTDLEPEEKKFRLTDEYNIPVNDKLREEMNTMCNLSQGLIDQGIEVGIERGIEQGIQIKALEEEKTSRNNVVAMHQDGLSVEKISRYSGRSKEEIQRWISEIES